ncbi:TetR/AcrR family transcriptional regulator [Nocardia tengchongensis]|uniref:TetR/AcrR family transcriptional regulator n=1 Tax=Nocardia tengchongensis TaxID=2055889 RepID=UPI0036ABEAD1
MATVQASRSARRSRVLASATEVFVSRGFHASTMEEIARRAGWTKPILYKEFSGKLDLYLAVLQHHVDALTGAVERALESTGVNHDRVRAAVHAYFDFVDHETQGFRLVFDSDVPSEPSVQLRIGRAYDDCVTAVSRLVAHDSGLDPYHAHLLAAGVVGASQSAAKYWLDTGRSIPKSDAVTAVITLCWGGLSRVPLQPAE